MSVGLGHAVRAIGRAIGSVEDAALHVVLGRRNLAVVVLAEQTVMRVRLLALGSGACKGKWWPISETVLGEYGFSVSINVLLDHCTATWAARVGDDYGHG